MQFKPPSSVPGSQAGIFLMEICYIHFVSGLTQMEINWQNQTRTRHKLVSHFHLRRSAKISVAWGSNSKHPFNLLSFKLELASVKMNQKVTHPKIAFGFVWSTYCELWVGLLPPSSCLQKKLNTCHGKIFWACCVFPCQIPFSQANIIIIPVSRLMNSHFTDQ